MLLLVFGLGQARALRRHHKQYFPTFNNLFALWTGLYWLCHIIWNKWNQFWVVVFCQWHVFSICIWLLPFVFTSMDDMCIRVQNVFWKWESVQSFAEKSKWDLQMGFSMWNGLRYWQQTAQLATWVQATENFVQPMGFSVLAIEKNCNVLYSTNYQSQWQVRSKTTTKLKISTMKKLFLTV